MTFKEILNKPTKMYITNLDNLKCEKLESIVTEVLGIIEPRGNHYRIYSCNKNGEHFGSLYHEYGYFTFEWLHELDERKSLRYNGYLSVFINKDDAYDFIISKLKEDKRKINQKIIYINHKKFGINEE